MKRKVKNIIMIVLIIVLLVTTYITMNYAKTNLSSKAPDMNNMGGMREDGETPPEMPDTNSEDNNNNSVSSSSNTTNVKRGNRVSGNNTSTDTEQDSISFDDRENMKKEGMPEVKITAIYYILFGLQSFVISILIGYLIISRLNKLTFKESITKTNIIIFIVIVIIITVALTICDGMITNKYFVTSDISNFDKSGFENEMKKFNNENSTNETTTDNTDVEEES